jgi:ankyrin repeat protein
MGAPANRCAARAGKCRRKKGFQPPGLAAFFGHLDVARFLLQRGAEVNSPTDNGLHVMLLHSAAANHHLEIARLLLEQGAMVNARQADDFTPLHATAQNGQLEMVKPFLEYGADVRAASGGGQTVLDFTQLSKNEDVIHLIETCLDQ